MFLPKINLDFISGFQQYMDNHYGGVEETHFKQTEKIVLIVTWVSWTKF